MLPMPLAVELDPEKRRVSFWFVALAIAAGCAGVTPGATHGQGRQLGGRRGRRGGGTSAGGAGTTGSGGETMRASTAPSS